MEGYAASLQQQQRHKLSQRCHSASYSIAMTTNVSPILLNDRRQKQETESPYSEILKISPNGDKDYMYCAMPWKLSTRRSDTPRAQSSRLQIGTTRREPPTIRYTTITGPVSWTAKPTLEIKEDTKRIATKPDCKRKREKRKKQETSVENPQETKESVEVERSPSATISQEDDRVSIRIRLMNPEDPVAPVTKACHKMAFNTHSTETYGCDSPMENCHEEQLVASRCASPQQVVTPDDNQPVRHQVNEPMDLQQSPTEEDYVLKGTSSNNYKTYEPQSVKELLRQRHLLTGGQFGTQPSAAESWLNNSKFRSRSHGPRIGAMYTRPVYVTGNDKERDWMNRIQCGHGMNNTVVIATGQKESQWSTNQSVKRRPSITRRERGMCNKLNFVITNNMMQLT